MKRVLQYTYVGVFMILISLIGLLTIFGVCLTSNESFMYYEKRMPLEKPSVGFDVKMMKTICQDYDRYINDNFSLRSQLIMTLSKLYREIGISIKPGKGIYGKKGYLFLGNEFNGVIDQASGRKKFTNNELSKWNKIFERRKEYIEKQGAQLFVCIIPNKHSVYPEYLPGYIKPAMHTSLQQILSSEKKYRLFSPLDSLLKAKSTWGDFLYYKTGTHWSFIGAYVGYLEIIKEISKDFPDLNPVELRENNFNIIRNYSGSDIPRLLYIKSMNDFRIEILKHPGWTDNLTKTTYSGDTLSVSSLEKVAVREKCVILNPLREKTLLLIKDSFSSWLAPFLNQTFNKIIYCHYEQAEGIELTQLVEKFKPDLVLYEIAERKLNSNQSIHPNILLKSRNNKLKKIIKLDLEELYSNIIRTNQVEGLDTQTGELHFLSTGKDPYLLLPTIDLPEVKKVVVKIDFSIPQNCTSKLFFKTEKDKHFTHNNSISIRVKSGRNVSYFEIPERNAKFNLRFDPGTFPGNYIIHSIEIFESKEPIKDH